VYYKERIYIYSHRLSTPFILLYPICPDHPRFRQESQASGRRQKSEEKKKMVLAKYAKSATGEREEAGVGEKIAWNEIEGKGWIAYPPL